MSKEEASSGGLLSKMVRFVRNPTVNWGELDSIQDDRESQYNKQLLKDMIERKRRNDFVRRREFDQLRKLRQREMLHGQRAEDPTARPSFFQSSMTSPDERAVTLKKIDEIEAQMSQQWWKSKQGLDAPTQPPDDMPEPLSASDGGPAGRAPVPAPSAGPRPSLKGRSVVQPLLADDSMVIDQFGSVGAKLTGGGPVEEPFRPSPPPAEPEPAFEEPEEFVHEPDLEEAAIRFANQDHAGAEAGLLDVLAQHQQDDPEQQLEIWMTLFDLYRATGQHERFDKLGLDYAARFNRTSPLWFSLPEQLGLAPQAESSGDASLAPGRKDFSWNSPSTLAVSSVAALNAALARAASPWTLSWARLGAIEEAAVPLLADQFTRWADKDGQMVFSGVEKFNALLGAKTQSGDRSVSPEWWRLRMAALRLMGKPDEFELVALDYCVTYEVSPPSWMPSLCGYSDNEGVTSGPAPLTAENDFLTFDMGEPQAAAPAPSAEPVAQLSGHIEGDATPLLEPFEALLRPGVPLSIACDALIRVDFAAAGSILNWAAERQGKGQVVHFHNLHRLVAIFFNVIGVNEHAWVLPRKN